MLSEFRTVLPYVKKYWYSYVLGLLFLVLTDAGQLYIPQILRKIINSIYSGNFEMREIFRGMLLIILAAALVMAGRFFWRFFIIGSSRRIEASLRQRLFDHMLVLSRDFFNRYTTGDLMARSTNDLNAVRRALGIGLIAFVDGSFMTLAILFIMFHQNTVLAGVTIIPLPAITFIILFFGKLLGPRFRRVQESFSSMSGHVQEGLSGIRVLKAFCREDHSTENFARKNDGYRKANMDLVRIWGLFNPAISFLAGISTLLLLYFGGKAVVAGTFTPGDFTAFLSYLGMMVWPMRGAGFTVNLIQRGGASLKRINEILDYEPQISNVTAPVETIEKSSFEVRNLSFLYKGEKKPVLHDIDFSLEEGKILGILGRTGSGKTTLLSLLTRQSDPPPGSVFLGGRDIRDYDLQTLRKHFAIVPQETFLFSTSIADNIAFGRPEAPMEAILSAAELSTIDRDVETFPRLWETEVGERGVTLSGGQKQRVSISRALILDPPVLVFDDALSAVDTETESRILSHLLVERKGKTSLIVSHRISTLQHADFIVVLDKGRIVESGSPEELLNKGGLFTRIATLQRFESLKENR